MNLRKNNYIFIFLIILLFFYTLSDVYVSFSTISLQEIREHKINCGSLINIFLDKTDYLTEKYRLVTKQQCLNMGYVKIINIIFNLLIIFVSYFLINKYLKNRKDKEDITDLLVLLKKINS